MRIRPLRHGLFYKCGTLLLIALLGCPLQFAAAEETTNQPIPPRAMFAIDRGLTFLASQQRADGSFATEPGQAPAITSLAIMAFLSRGHTPGQGPYGTLLNKSIDWVLLQQQPDGLLASNSQNTMYNHGICTIMLCEVYAMTDAPRQKRIHTALASALRLILDSQRIKKSGDDQGGWRYTPTATDSDISVTGWQLMALRGAGNLGAAIPGSSLTDGLNYMLKLSGPSGGFGYRSNAEPTPTRTGIGVLTLELLGQHNHPSGLAGGDYLMSHPPLQSERVNYFYYAAYYCSQAANQLGGKYWTNIYFPLRDSLLTMQAANGSWSGDASDEHAGNAYATAMSVLALSVPLHYLPLYQR